MSALISPAYLEQNRLLHEQRPDYGAHGNRFVPQIKELCELLHTRSVLDYGCGKALLRATLGPMVNVTNYDPAIQQYAMTPEPHDLVVCQDVLEHIEPEFLDAVLDDLARVTRKVLFANVATRPAVKALPDGRNAHLIQEHMRWWLPKFFERFEIMSVNNLGGQEFLLIAKAL